MAIQRITMSASMLLFLSLLTAACGSAAPLPKQRVSFVNDVVPALTRAGCNAGTCHGAAAGKNGFKLSLRGYAPELDYAAITRQAGGRRVCKTAPERSLLLRKPLLELPHRGGLALRCGAPEYALLAHWLAQGAPGPDPRDPHVVELTVEPLDPGRRPGRGQDAPSGRAYRPTPNAQRLTLNATLHLRVLARFSNGSRRDVTYWTRFASNDEMIATVAQGGAVKMIGEGETAITVGYQDKVAIARVAVPFGESRGGPHSLLSTLDSRLGYVDALINAKLAALNLVPSPPASDRVFVRRLSLDLIGTLPTPEEVRAFCADRDPKKRERIVDALLQRPEFTDFWAYKWCDLFRVNRGMLKDKGMWAFYAWVHESVRTNKPWNAMVREALTATGNTFLDGPANYFRTSQKTEELAENISQGFLGIRVQCARCHNHPLEKWTQNEYYGMANLFARVGRKINNDPWVNDEMTLYNLPSGDIVQPRLGHPLPPKPLGGPTLALDAPQERRAFFADWLTSPKNRQFARSIVNRVWAHFMGRGLVESVDDLRETNPPTNPALLDALCDDFVKHRFDLRYLMRRIVASQAYQRTSEVLSGNRKDDRYYSRYFVRRLAAEQLLDALSQVTGQPEAFPGQPPGVRAIQLPDTHVRSEFMDNFGRPARQITCECERSQEPNMSQALLFINGDILNQKVTADGGLAGRLVKAGRSDSEILDTLYWTALGRPPAPAERAANLVALRKHLTPQPPSLAARSSLGKGESEPRAATDSPFPARAAGESGKGVRGLG